MNKSIRNIVLLLIVFILLGMIPIFSILNSSSEVRKFNKDTNIVVNDEGKIKVTDQVTFFANKNKNAYITIPQSLLIESNGINPSNVSIKLNNELLHVNGTGTNIGYFVTNTEFVVRNIYLIKDKEYKIDINYEYNAQDVVNEYNNVSVLKLLSEGNISETNIRIQLSQKTSKFQIKSGVKKEYLGNNTYNINGKLVVPTTELIIDKGNIKNAKIIDDEYRFVELKNFESFEENIIVKTIIMCLLLSLISFIIILIITKKVRCEKRIIRQVDEVIEPILAEAIIDRKIGAKELVMSCIVDLITRGNLQNIENERIKLLNYDKMTNFEIEIIGLIFKEENQIVSFDEIKNIFINNNKITMQLLKKFISIKNKIENKLFEDNIYSKVGEKILKFFKILSIDIILISLYLLWVGIIVQEMIIVDNLVICTVICTVISIVISNLKINFIKLIFKIFIFNIICFPIFLALIASAIYMNLGSYVIGRIFNDIVTTMLILVVIFINIIILVKTKNHIFTKLGKNEFEKAQGLKQYIVEYSLIKERDLESTIIWDKYLAYAVAFGIPNKITNRFGENLMNTNVILQKIEALLKF